MASVITQRPPLLRVGLAVHRASAAAAQKDRSQRICVLGPGLTGSPDVALLDFLAGLPGLHVDQGGVQALDELAVDHYLAGIGGIADQILEDVPGEDDRHHTVVVSLAVAARRLDAAAVEMFGQ